MWEESLGHEAQLFYRKHSVQGLAPFLITKVAHPTLQIAHQHRVKEHTQVTAVHDMKSPYPEHSQTRAIHTPEEAQKAIDVHTVTLHKGRDAYQFTL